MRHEERVRQLLGQPPDVSHEQFDRGCLPAALYLLAVLVVGLLVDWCAIQ